MTRPFLSPDRLWLGDAPQPAEFIPDPEPLESVGFPSAWRERILIDSIHGGDAIPPEFLPSLSRCLDFKQAYILEKDWGANQVAARLAHKLGLAGFFRVNIARCLMDFGRFPGETPPGADHLRRFAISDPAARYLSHEEKRSVLRSWFDPISSAIEGHVQNSLLKIAVHTYDKLNEAGTERPLVSLIFRPASYQANNRMPYGVFDRIYPDHLAEFTADRRLTSRISLELEKRGITVAYNYPYLMPEGSVEFRAQVWFFFQFLRERFVAAHPELAQSPDYLQVWEMLQDTNLRSARSAALRSHLHLFRTVSAEQEHLFHRYRQAYEHIERFLIQEDISTAYRTNPERPGSLALEIRKDFVWRFADDACRHPLEGPEGARWENIDRITTELARAIRIYLCEDRIPVVDEIPEGRIPISRW